MSRKSTSCNQVWDRKGGGRVATGVFYDEKGRGKRDGNNMINGVIDGASAKMLVINV